MEIINNVAMLSIILTRAALIREREHGTIEHLLVMPVTPTEIVLAKIWSMSFVVLISAAFSLVFIVQGILKVPIEGSIGLFFNRLDTSSLCSDVDGDFDGDTGTIHATVWHVNSAHSLAIANALRQFFST